MISTDRLPKGFKEFLKNLLAPKVPRQLSQRFRELTQQNRENIEASLRRNYYANNLAGLDTEGGRLDMYEHSIGRLHLFRTIAIPWLNSARPLKGSRVLEIGCGTGSSTVALAEQGADVTAIDVADQSLAVAKDRCQEYRLDVNFYNANATEVGTMFAGNRFDFVVFFASLEHMTHDERMLSMKETWNMIAPGSMWCVIDTPNRLWYFDGHTSFLPFFQWLPDDLAFKYSQFSERNDFREVFRELTPASMLQFLRLGRGVSYHEFELAMGRIETLNVVSSLPIYLRNQNVIKKLAWKITADRRLESLLSHIGPPGLHKGFYQKSLELILRKN